MLPSIILVLFSATTLALLVDAASDDNDGVIQLSQQLNTLEQKHFDFLIFTQHWPVTVCYDYLEESKHHECSLPSPNEIWTIHGIWPTKNHTLGPFFCNRTWDFNIANIDSIEDEMEKLWINIEKDTPLDGLWRHEWTKHGTCAAQLPVFAGPDAQAKYFGQGLKWLESYSMTTLLNEANILPGNAYEISLIAKVLRSRLMRHPVVECRKDKRTGKSFIFEIRICFSKELELADCDGVITMLQTTTDESWRLRDDLITNCDENLLVEYPGKVPPTKFEEMEENRWKFPYVNFYKLLQLVKWITL